MKKKNEIGGICDFEFLMRNSCRTCPIGRICEEYEEREKNKISDTKKIKQSDNKRISKAKQQQNNKNQS